MTINDHKLTFPGPRLRRDRPVVLTAGYFPLTPPKCIYTCVPGKRALSGATAPAVMTEERTQRPNILTKFSEKEPTLTFVLFP